MKKVKFYFLSSALFGTILMIVFGVTFASCGKEGKTFADYLKEQQEAIDALIAKSALNYVGHNAIVRMIVPFDNGLHSNSLFLYGIGSAYQEMERVPIYYDRMLFLFD
jgi:hypothetical protein